MNPAAPPFDAPAVAPGPDATPPAGVAPFLPARPAPGLVGLADRLDALLPQTQCTRCGYPDCRAYAEALVGGEAPNRCPPGGEEGVRRLAAALGRPALPLDPATGAEGPRQRVFIDEARCIGCTLCIQACPVDAIIGAAKRMHTVIEPLCTGCELCLPACPVDCILLENASGPATGWDAWSTAQADEARERHAARRTRLERDERERAVSALAAARPSTDAPSADAPSAAAPSAAAPSAAAPPTAASSAAGPSTAGPADTAPSNAAPVDPKHAAIAAALARARARLRP